MPIDSHQNFVYEFRAMNKVLCLPKIKSKPNNTFQKCLNEMTLPL